VIPPAFYRAIALVPVIVATVCPGPTPGYCPRAEARRPLVPTGNVHFSVHGLDVSQSLPLANRDCEATAGVGASWGRGDRKAPLLASLALGCLVRSARVRVALSASVDKLASTTEGTFPVTIKYAYDIPGESTHRACEARSEGQLVVTRAVGGEAPVPALVTPDFVREIRIDVHNAAPIEGVSVDQPCSPLTIDATLTLVIRAADIDSQPDHRCPPSLG